MVDLHNTISVFQDRLSTLLSLYTATRKENQQLKGIIENQKKIQQTLELKIKETEGQLAAAMMNKGGNMDPIEKAKWVKKIDKFIKEIDHGIKNLTP